MAPPHEQRYAPGVEPIHPLAPADAAPPQTLSLMTEQTLSLLEEQVSGGAPAAAAAAAAAPAAPAAAPAPADSAPTAGSAPADGRMGFKGGGEKVLTLMGGVRGFETFKKDPEAWLSHVQQKGELQGEPALDIPQALASGRMTERAALIHVHNENMKLHARLDHEVATRQELAEGLGYVRRELAEAGEPVRPRPCS